MKSSWLDRDNRISTLGFSESGMWRHPTRRLTFRFVPRTMNYAVILKIPMDDDMIELVNDELAIAVTNNISDIEESLEEFLNEI